MLKALWTGEYEEASEARLSGLFSLTRVGLNVTGSLNDLLDEDHLIDALHGVDVLIAGYDNVTARVLESSPDLKVILSGRDGPEENVDMGACTEMGIPVFSGGGRCAHSVSELTLALMLDLSRSITRSASYIQRNGWTSVEEQETFGFGNVELYGKTLSIIGLGKNGRALARIARGLGMNIVAYDPYVSAETAEELGVELVGLMEAMAAGDYVCTLARVTDETRGMIGAEQVAAMKPSAYFVNTGRAALTDDEAILDALEQGRIRGAAFDVFPQEPLGPSSRYYEIPEDRIILTPHIAGLSVDRVPHQYENLLNGFCAFRNGERSIDNLYNPDVFDSATFPTRGGSLLRR